jgi:ribonuclease P protein component
MIAKRYRLPIQFVAAKRSRVIRAGGLTLKIFTTNLPFGRFGVIIPKAVVKSAVARNSLKRAAFDSFRAKQLKLPAFDVLCIASSGAPLTRNGMMKELSTLLGQLSN